MYKAPDTFTNAPPSCNIVNQLKKVLNKKKKRRRYVKWKYYNYGTAEKGSTIEIRVPRMGVSLRV